MSTPFHGEHETRSPCTHTPLPTRRSSSSLKGQLHSVCGDGGGCCGPTCARDLSLRLYLGRGCGCGGSRALCVCVCVCGFVVSYYAADQYEARPPTYPPTPSPPQPPLPLIPTHALTHLLHPTPTHRQIQTHTEAHAQTHFIAAVSTCNLPLTCGEAMATAKNGMSWCSSTRTHRGCGVGKAKEGNRDEVMLLLLQ